jgi:hypothetical protein
MSVLARVAGTVLGMVLLVGADAPAAGAQTAPPRPAFASPFTCGQVWFARTYAGHPLFAIDWNLPGASDADFGQHVLAGAPGIVTVELSPGYGLMVTIDHGDGWSTRYAHLSAAAVATGDRVDASTLVGAVGSSGYSDSPHLHQEQLLNGVRQPILVDGHTVDASYSSRGTSYASANCLRPTRKWASPWRRGRLGRPLARPLP